MADNVVVPFGEHQHDHPPAAWVAYLEATQPRCGKCEERPVHLPGAKTCLECRSDNPGPARRRTMYGILHAGGVYCGRCLVRPSPAPGRSFPRCYAMRTADTLRRRMEALIRRADVHLQAATDAVTVPSHEEDVETASQAVDNAHLACSESSPILEAAFDILPRMLGIHLEKAMEAEGVLVAALTRAGEVTNLVADALFAVIARQAGLG